MTRTFVSHKPARVSQQPQALEKSEHRAMILRKFSVGRILLGLAMSTTAAAFVPGNLRLRASSGYRTVSDRYHTIPRVSLLVASSERCTCCPRSRNHHTPYIDWPSFDLINVQQVAASAQRAGARGAACTFVCPVSRRGVLASATSLAGATIFGDHANVQV